MKQKSNYFLNKWTYAKRCKPQLLDFYHQSRMPFEILLKVKDFTKLNNKLQQQAINFINRNDLASTMRNYKIPMNLLKIEL